MTRRQAVALALALLPSVAFAQAPPEFGPMATYTIGLLKRGPQWTPEKTEESARIQAAHMAHIKAMWEEGILIGAGPFADTGYLRGIFLFGPGKEEAALKRAAQDPAVVAGRLVVGLHPWMGPAGIGDAYRESVTKNPGKPDEMVTLPFVLLRRSPNATAPTADEMGRVMPAHFASILAAARAGTLLAAGPVLDGSDLAGLLFYAPQTSMAAARTHAEADPTVKAGWVTVELHPWMVGKGVLPDPWPVKPAAK